ncbi:hypothetical protein AWM70_00020 [Paenibacillus yonginensis]|uniref:Small peptidoglycan-associated lipoprotein n=1 Tax=Paenibacillus yonginensis TaxID=1462996 RepID=A0A1B1MVG7_9BACL|nr:hypothetical protein [Paenibacillus yonginensis]ANS73166.1 hypothetical protein AWM70_00020 [Paenibacillus yonginensis]
MFRLFSVLAVFGLTLFLISGCSNQKNIQEYLSKREHFNLIVFVQSNYEETRDNLYQKIAFENWIFDHPTVYDVNTEEGKQRAKDLHLKSYPAYLLFNQKKLLVEDDHLDNILSIVLEDRLHPK